ncbi:TonB-dependent receptor plug domain-containing protein [Marinomonas sp. 15G1-11]|uniref:TonB-dependent receptor plug domain-containing protein n=1 Tax=Marinomonas phaeophyticola TaxID=3004091 RepID=A0ABT4JSC9_9GAMM|nr:TonB-dependent receptor plug domain-containing protein [Marinomonas sp. 15G1-11]MCZ2721283.1 TonB-dependent receptor plug domain-containing protein [Marinomonas sp. 15G1-11]
MKLALPITLILFNFPAYAEETHSAMKLDELVVTGTRSQKTLSDTPVRTEVITKEQLQTHNAKTVAEALRGIPNILLKPIHGKSGFEVWMQGLSSDRVKILIDGLPVSATTGSSVDVTQLSTVGVERIEIVKGATSALYGSSAMGGVVNVITEKVSGNRTRYALSLEAGSFAEDNPNGDELSPAFRRVSATGVSTLGTLTGRVSADLSDSDGFDATPNTWSTQGARGMRSTLGVDLVWNKTATTQYSFGVERYAEDLKSNLQENVGGKAINKIKMEDTERIRLDSTAQWDLEQGVLSASFIKETLDNTTYQDVVVTPEKEERRDASLAFQQANLDWMMPISAYHTLNVGGQIFEETLSQKKNHFMKWIPTLVGIARISMLKVTCFMETGSFSLE